MAEKNYKFQLWQDGMLVAAVDAPSRQRALQEISHYAAMYGRDGPVQVREVRRRPVKPLVTSTPRNCRQ